MSDYKNPAITIDGVVFCLLESRLCVLLVRRSHEPFINAWSLPGGYISHDETSRQALGRVLRAKADVRLEALGYAEQLYTFDTEGVQGGNAISVVYYGLYSGVALQDGPNRRFVPVDELPELAYQHEAIVRYAHERLKNKIMYTNILFALLPDLFTLTELQATYEEILGKKLDKRNFRKKIQLLDLIEPTDEYRKEGAHRPARLHRFKNQKLKSLSRSFD